MLQGSKSRRTEAVPDAFDAAIARFRRQLRIRNILLVVVGIEATAFIVLRAMGVL